MNRKFLTMFATIATSVSIFANANLQGRAIDHFVSDSMHIQEATSADYQPYRILQQKDIGGHSFRTDDGAVWIVQDETSKFNVLNWRENDTIVIHPCFSPFFSGGKFYIENDRTKTTATVSLALSPYTASDTSVCISSVLPYSNEIYVVDAFNRLFRFVTEPSDFGILQSWQTGHYVLFGSNEECFCSYFSDHPYIIININTREYVRGTMVSY